MAKRAAEAFQQQVLKKLSEDSNHRPPVQEPLAGYIPPEVTEQTLSSIPLINSPTPNTSIENLDYFVKHLPARHRRKARELLLKLKRDFQAEIGFNEQGNVFVDGNSLPNADLKDLLSATFNSRKSAEGLEGWLDKLHQLGLGSYINQKRLSKTQKQGPIELEDQWWCLV